MDSAPADFYSNVLAQLKVPALVRYEKNNYTNKLMPGLPSNDAEVKISALVDLKGRLSGATQTECKAVGTKCYKFSTKDGKIVAVFTYDTAGDGNNPILPDEVIYASSSGKFVILGYINPNKGENLEEFWKDPNNVASILLDDGTVKREVEKIFKNFKGGK